MYRSLDDQDPAIKRRHSDAEHFAKICTQTHTHVCPLLPSLPFFPSLLQLTQRFLSRGCRYPPLPSAPNTPPCKYVAHTPAWALSSTRLPHVTHTNTRTHRYKRFASITYVRRTGSSFSDFLGKYSAVLLYYAIFCGHN